MRRLVGTVAVAMALTGCARAADSDDRPHIVVTTNILGDVVASTVGDAARVTTLMRPNADPHSFEISAREAAMMRDADLIVSNGLGLEEGLQRHLDRTADAGVETYVVGEQIDVLDYSDGDAEGTPDPHFWTDPARMLDVVDGLEAAVTDIDGIDERAVEQAAAEYRTELESLDQEMTDSFASIPEGHRSLVTNHHVFGYLAERFGFRVVGAVIPGGTTLAAPSAADLRDLTEAIERAGVRTIFAESSQPDRLIQVLADEAGVDVEVSELFTESLAEKGEGADTYLTMMRANTERITSGLSPRPTD
ncbi:zinc/manganese transport system substrate-binding protein [Nocardioides sp. YR527]|uniref:zinc ABC transporter substrate-binding protein AztC n=1 Tax=Nocardioides sp. YR527 TaxID=1881028 RepID=UPI0008923429|nr:zinc ABC transporter substrate-binding protein AztC [Nocardioides sp. YR527]SDK27837.1 zinc/manganese transport system substrate-binding protein [Nocardioides sp. YR527]